MRILEPYFSSKDGRGEILGICQFDWIREINYIESLAGSTRGGHYHKKTQELFFIIDGKIEVAIEDLRTKDKKQVTVEKGNIFVVEPYEVHTFHILEDAKWVNALSSPMDPQNPDFHYGETKASGK